MQRVNRRVSPLQLRRRDAATCRSAHHLSTRGRVARAVNDDAVDPAVKSLDRNAQLSCSLSR